MDNSCLKVIIKDCDQSFIDILTQAISRRGYSVYKKEDGREYGVRHLNKPNQDGVKVLVAQLCDHYGKDYTITD